MFDTEPLYHRAADTLLQRRGHRYEDAVRRQMMGQPGPVAIQVMIDYYGLNDSWESVLAESDAIFAALEGLFPLIDYLGSRRVPWGVATSSRRRFAEEILERGGVAARARFLITGEDVAHGKPAPDIYLMAAKRMGIAPEEMLVLEDSENGTLAGVTAAALTVAVPGPHSRDHCFDGARMVASSLSDPDFRHWLDRHLT